MYTPPFRRRTSLSYTEAALTALALAVPVATPIVMMAMPQAAFAQNLISVSSGGATSAASCDGAASACYSSLSGGDLSAYVVSAGGQLTSTGSYTLIGGGSANFDSAGFSGNAINVSNYDFTTSGGHFNVVGGGYNVSSASADVTDNRVTIGGSAYVDGKVVGGINGGSGGTVTSNIVTLNGGRFGDDVIGGVGAGSVVSSVSDNKVIVGGGTVVSGSVIGGWSVDRMGDFGSALSGANNASVSNNEVTISGGGIRIVKDVKGGVSQLGEASSNIVDITGTGSGVTIGSSVIGGEVGAAGSAGAIGNTVTVGGNVTVSGGIIGGLVNNTSGGAAKNVVTINANESTKIVGSIIGAQTSGSAVVGGTSAGDANVVAINGGGSSFTVGGDIKGGNALGTGAAQFNEVNISAIVTQTSGSIYGGYANSGVADSNIVSLSGTVTQNSGSIYGGYSVSGSAAGNNVLLNGAVTQTKGSIYGGYSVSAGASGNSATLAGVTQSTSGSVYGGYVASAAGAATNNVVTIESGTYGKVYGGYANSGNATSNTVTINDGSASEVYGGYVANGASAVTSNTVTINGGTFGKVVGGHANSGNAIGNEVIISGGTFGTVIGGETTSGGSAISNVVTLVGAANITDLYGGKAISGGIVLTGNELNKDSEAATVKNAQGFATVNFSNYDSNGNANIDKLDTGSASSNVTLDTGDHTVTFAAATPATSSFNSATGDYDVVSGTNNQIIIGGGGIVKTGEGKLILAAGNTYTGDTTISQGSLEVEGTLGSAVSGSYTYAGAIVNSGGLAFTNPTSSVSQKLTSAITGNGNLTKDGESTLILAGGNTYTGGTTINGGKLQVTGTLGTGNSYGGLIENNASLEFNQAANQTLTGEISGDGSLTKAGSGSLTLAGVNTYTGETKVTAGDLILNAVDAIKDSSNVVLEGKAKTSSSAADTIAHLILGADNQVNELSGNQFSDVTLHDSLGDYTLTVSIAAGRRITFDGKLINAGGVEKIDGGTWVLRGDNTRLGSLQINGGSVAVVGQNANSDFRLPGAGELGTGNDAGTNGVTVDSGGTFETVGNAKVGKAGGNGVTVNSGGTLDIEAVESSQNEGATFNAPVVLANGATFKLGGDASWATEDNPVAKFLAGLSLGETAKVEAIFAEAPKTPDGLFGNRDDYANVYSEIWDKISIQSGFLTRLEMNEDGEYVYKTTEQAKALSEGFLGSVALVTQGGDLVTDQGMSNAVSSARSGVGAGFAALGGGSVKYKSGSHVDVSGVSLVAGIAANVGSGATVGAFAEYGDGNYDSYNNFSTGKVKGSGDTDYVGAGVLGRIDLPKTANGQPYLEGTVRFGQVKSDYKTGDLYNPVLGPSVIKYNLKSSYYGASFGGGHTWNLSGDNTIDLYGRYVWTRQAADKARLFTGEEIKFSAVDSQRVRIGTRYSAAWDRSNRFYVGAAWEHEFDGDANAKVGGGKVDAPSLKGNTGIAEFGLVLTPSDNKNLTVDLGIQAYGGKHKGATGTAQLKFVF